MNDIDIMNLWLFKEEPLHYAFEDLVKDKKTQWDGVKNNLAQKNLGQVRKGDEVFFYHTGKEKAIIGTMKVITDAYKDKKGMFVVDVKPSRKLKRSIELKEIKALKKFQEFDLVRLPRLSIMPVSENYWKIIIKLSEKE